MKLHHFAALFLLTLALGCRSNELERSRVPLIWGMRFDSPAAEADANPNLAMLRDLKMRDLMLELPLVADTNGLPSIPMLPFGSMKGLLLNYRVGLNLTIAPTATKEVFPKDSLTVSPDAWFAALRTEIQRVLDAFAPCPIDRVVVGSSLTPVEQYGDLWKSTFDSLRRGGEIMFSYGSTLENLANFPLLKASDEFALDYRPMSGDDLKDQSRDYHAQIEHITDSLHMPLFIFRANILGEDPVLQFKNRLRFWQPKTRFRGLAVNTLYSRIPFRDSTSYYGVADNPDFLEFVKEYKQRD